MSRFARGRAAANTANSANYMPLGSANRLKRLQDAAVAVVGAGSAPGSSGESSPRGKEVNGSGSGAVENGVKVDDKDKAVVKAAAKKEEKKKKESKKIKDEVREEMIVDGVRGDDRDAVIKAAKKAEKKAEKAARKAAKQSEKGGSAVDGSEQVGEDVKSSKKRKRGDDEDDDEAVLGKGAVEGKASKKSKKGRLVVESDDARLDALIAEQEKKRVGSEKKEKKDRKEKKSREIATEESDEPMLEVQEGDDIVPAKQKKEDKKDKKGKKDKKEKKKDKKVTTDQVDDDVKDIPIPITTTTTTNEEEDSETLTKEQKKARKKAAKEAKQAAKSTPPIPTVPNSGGGGEQWNANALTGDIARKSKFLRLLGAGKGASTSGAAAVVSGGREKGRGSKDVEEIRRAETELERQFEAGIKMKHDGGGKRRGLGA